MTHQHALNQCDALKVHSFSWHELWKSRSICPAVGSYRLKKYFYCLTFYHTFISLTTLFCLQKPALQSARVLTSTHWCLTKFVMLCRGRPLNSITLVDRSNTATFAVQSSATERAQQSSPFLWQLSPLSLHTCIISNNVNN